MDNYCIIMAGGVGSRFWPKSKKSMPKQFLDFLGTGETLIQQTYRRFAPIVKAENFYVVTNARYKDLVLEQLPELSEQQVLLEPVMRNTAPCIAYAAFKIAAKSPEANIVVTPADQLITKEAEFQELIREGLEHTAQNNHLVTLGIEPTRPDTGYGYIEADRNDSSFMGSFKKVAQFREKPNRETAESYVASGNFSWNSGMFIWSLASILDAFETHLPEVHEAFKGLADSYHTDKEQSAIDVIYPACEEVSIDYGIMEKASNVYTMRADIGWSDLGTWGSIYTHLDRDEDGNATVGERVIIKNCKDTLIQSIPGKTVVAEGLDDFIVVDTPESLLIIRKSEEQEIKPLRAEVGKRFDDDLI